MISKNGFISKLILLFIIFVSSNANANSFWGSANIGGQLDELSMTFGIKGSKPIGGFISIGFESDYNEDDILDYRCPHSDYSIKDEDALIGGTYGFGMLVFFSSSKSNHHKGYAGFGLYMRDTWKVVESNVTGWLYKHGEDHESIVGLCIGYMYINDKDLIIGAEYSTGKGIGFTIGRAF